MKVTLLAHSMLTFEGCSTIENVCGGDWLDRPQTPTEWVIELATRICYSSLRKLGHNPFFVRETVKRGHESVIEHASATFLIEGISRSCLAQLTRHRLASYSVMSQRYVNQSNASQVTPPSIALNPLALDKFTRFAQEAMGTYDDLIALGIRKEDARFVLPEATETTVVMTANFREWRHFLNVRLDKAAQWEIKKLAQLILSHLTELAPNVFDDIAG